VLEGCGDAPHDRQKRDRELEMRASVRVYVEMTVCVVPRLNGHFAKCPTDDDEG
jgi:hypothetical protein